MRNFAMTKFAFVSVVLFLAVASSAQAEPADGVNLSGSWSGYWQSSTNRHHGPLQGYFTKCTDGSYNVTFKGRFFRIFPFRYSVNLRVVKEEAGKVTLAGNSYLGRLFGTFTYHASATDTDFVCYYNSCRYTGCFVLKKCCTTKVCCN